MLSWNKQIETLSLKLSRAHGILSKLRNFVSLEILTTVYHWLFYLYVFYGCLVWNCTNRANLDLLVRLQKSCMPILSFSRFRSHPLLLLKQLNIVKIEHILITQKLFFMYDFHFHFYV